MSLSFKNLSKIFENNKVVLDDLSFDLPLGKFSGLVGPSGCGKTTLLRILAGLEQASSGRIEIEGELWLDLGVGEKSQETPGKMGRKTVVAPEKRNVGMVFQSYAIWPHMTVAENIAFPLKIRKRSKEEIKREVEKHLDIVGLKDFGDRHPDTLSGGQQQRVAMARALIQHPRLLLLDEPLSNLDASLRASMRSEIRRIQQQLNLTSVIVTHDWADVEGLCDNIVVLNNGKIEQMGSPAELKSQPKNDFVKSLIKAG